MTSRTARTLIVPVESQVRELDAKLLFACEAAERGFPVIIGSRAYIHFLVPFLAPGVYLAKSMRSLSDRMFSILHDLGHDIVAWDEEALVRFASPEYYSWRYSKATFDRVSHLFAWGPDDAEWFTGYHGYRGTPIHTTGNPRIDLLRREVRDYFRSDAEALRERFGDFILVNTNFSFVNNFVPRLNLVQPAASGKDPTVSARAGKGLSLEFARGMAAHQQAIFEHFLALMPRLMEWYPERAIVLRPHPSENHEIWRAILRNSSNIHVLHEGNVIPWLMASRVLLHNGCTTAIEAAVLETPVVAYRPVSSSCYDYHLPNSLSHAAFSAPEVRQQIADVLAGRLGPVNENVRRRLFARHLTGTAGPLAVTRCVNVLEQAGYAGGLRSGRPTPKFLAAWVKANARTLQKRVNMLRPNHPNSAAYHAHRFPQISSDEINARIRRFGRQLGRFENVHAAMLSQHIFRVSSDLEQQSRPFA